MYVSDFKKFMDGADTTKMPLGALSYPSKNIIISRVGEGAESKVSTRGGIENDGTAATEQTGVHSEFVWRDSLGGERPMRVWGQTVQVKYSSRWYTIYTALDSGVVRCFFATFVDGNTTFIKKRLIISDGSPHLYSWNGAIGVVESATTNTAVFATATGTCLAQGFDAGDVTAQAIMHFIGTAVTASSEESQTNDPTAQTLSISGTFDTTPIADDIIIAKPVKFSNEVSSAYDIDVVYQYKNHVVTANYDSTSMYFSHVETYSLASGLNFTMPAAGDRTAITPFLLKLDGNFTAMRSRKNILWVSDKNDWYKLTKTATQNEYDLWVDVEKFETGELKGAQKMAMADYKGDLIYVAQDKTIQRVETIEVLGEDRIRTISDDIEALLERTTLTDVRIYYLERAIYIISPDDGLMIILDMLEGWFQPPQYMPLSCMSVIDGVKYGHHDSENSTFELFTGRSDLDASIEAKIAFGYQQGQGNTRHPFRYKQHDIFGVSCRLNLSTVVEVEEFWEENGAKSIATFEIDGGAIKTYDIDDDVSWATHPYGERSIGGADMEAEMLKRAMVFNKSKAISYFDYRPIFTIKGDNSEFHLLGWYINEKPSERQIGNDLFIAK